MKSLTRFYIKFMIFAGIVLAIVLGVNTLFWFEPTRLPVAEMTDTVDYISGLVDPAEIIPYIKSVEYYNPNHKLIIGDSVSRQLFTGLEDMNPDFLMVPSNGCITLSGQYILAHMYMESHPDAEAIYLFLLPDSFLRTYNTSLGYQYAVAPFVMTGTTRFLDDNTIRIMEDTYGSQMLRWRVATFFDVSGIARKLYLNILPKFSNGYMPDNPLEISDQYLSKLADECRERGVTLYLYPCPVCESARPQVEAMQGYDLSVIESVNPDYFDEIVYYDPVESSDGVHFTDDYANRDNYDSKLREMLKGTPLEDELRLR